MSSPWPSRFPIQPLHHLDALWIQVAGTLCNLHCTHCFVPSGPGEDRHGLLARAEVRRLVGEALGLGVKEFYFTGGEPFVHPEMNRILEDTLAEAPCTVLTNGTLFTSTRLEALAVLSEASKYSLEIRVSLDGPSAEEHDRFRGAGSFERTLDGLRRLEQVGLLPIVTVTRATDEDERYFRERYLSMLRGCGLSRPRLKVLPLFRLGREVARSGPYSDAESLLDLDPEIFDPHRMQCGSSRAVTSQGVFVCPLLVDEPGARMGASLDQAMGPFRLAHGACHTCWSTGMTCGNG